MAQRKAHEVDAYLGKPEMGHRTILLYGPDAGLVSERAARLAKSTGVDLSDPFSTIRIDADDAAQSTRIADEAHTVSMFGGERLVWIQGSTQRNLANAVQPVLDLPPTDTRIIIEAGDLKKSAPLRTRIEKSPHAIALPCYQDQARALDAVIDEEFQKAGLNASRDTRAYLKSLLGGDRMASRAEVQKLCLYATGEGEVTVEHVDAIVGDASALTVDTVIDAAAIGDIPTMEHMFKRLVAQGTSIVPILLGMQRHFQMLHEARARMEANRLSPQAIISGLRPPINFQRKDKVTRALAIWPLGNLQKTLKRLDSVSFESRANSALGVSLASTALLAIAIEARQLNR